MKNLLLLLFTVISTSVLAQNKIFKGKEIPYSIQLDSAVVFQKMTVPSGVAEAYVLMKEGGFKYIAGVQMINGFTGEKGMIFTDDFRKGFLNTCKCEILNTQPVKYAHIEGARFYARIAGKAQPFMAYFVIVQKTSMLYQVMVLTTESDAGNIEQISREIFDSVMFEE